MDLITERIAGMSLSTVLLILTALTAVRAALLSARTVALRFLTEVLESVLLAFGIVFLILRPFVVQSYYIPSDSMHPTLWEGDHILVNKWLYRLHPPRRGDVIVFRAPSDPTTGEREFIKRVVGLPGDTIEVQEGYVVVGVPSNCQKYPRDQILACLGQQYTMDQADEDAGNMPSLRLTTDAIWLGDRRIDPADFARAAGRPGEPVSIHPGRVLRNGQMLMEGYVAEDAQYHMPPCVVPPGQLFVMGDNRNVSIDSHIWGTLPESRVVGRADLVFWPLSHFKRITSCGQE